MRRRAARSWAIGLFLVCLAATAAACGNSTDTSATRSEVLNNLSRNVIVPAYERLETTTADLATAVDTLCAAPSPANLTAARGAWTEAWSAWNRTRAFRFGPLTDMRVGGNVAFMIDPTKVDANVLGGDPTIGPPFTANTLENAGSDTRGLGAVEHLLFASVTSPVTNATACSYAAAAAAVSASTASDIRKAWTDGIDGDPPYAEQLAKPGEFFNAQEAVNDLVNGMSMALTEAARELASADAADPGQRDGVDTQHGGARVRDILASVAAVYFGSPSGTSGDAAGIDNLVTGVSTSANERASDIIRRAVASTKRLPDSLNDATTAQLRQSYLKVRPAGTITRAEVASELGVTLSLGDADGDS